MKQLAEASSLGCRWHALELEAGTRQNATTKMMRTRRAALRTPRMQALNEEAEGLEVWSKTHEKTRVEVSSKDPAWKRHAAVLLGYGWKQH